MAEPRPGQPFGAFEIEAELGRGGMAIVYKAYQRDLSRHVALKVLAPHLLGDPTFVERFQGEARTAASLEHSNIVPIYEVGEVEGTPYIAMRLIEGETLAAKVARSGQLPLNAVLSLVTQLAQALDFAHSNGVVHRDVKPTNILVDEHGRAYLADFGIARASDQSRHTRTGALVGTPEYMSPEQVQGRPVTDAADRYALGVIAYELLTGRPPFQAETVASVLHAQVYETPQRLHRLRADLPSGIEGAVSRMLDKDPARRWPSGAEFAAELRNAIENPGRARDRSLRARQWVPILLPAATAAAVGALLFVAPLSINRTSTSGTVPSQILATGLLAREEGKIPAVDPPAGEQTEQPPLEMEGMDRPEFAVADVPPLPFDGFPSASGATPPPTPRPATNADATALPSAGAQPVLTTATNSGPSVRGGRQPNRRS